MLKTPMLPLLLAAALAAPVAAQQRYNFDIDSAASPFTFGGSVTIPSLGTYPILGNPSNAFQPSGTSDLDLTTGTALTNGQLVSGIAPVIVPTLSAKVQPIPFLPPAATVVVSGVRMQMTSPAFTVDGTGAFSTDVTATMLAGTAVIAGIVNLTLDLTGQQTTPQTIAGTITHGAAGFRLRVPIRLSFPFSDTGSGISGTLTLDGTLAAEDRSFNVDRETMDAALGGFQNFTYSAGGAQAGNVYLVLGTVSGTSPGFQITPTLRLPLNPDGWTSTTLVFFNTGPFIRTAGTLDSLGIANGVFFLPPLPFLAGITFHHAYVGFASGTPVFTSNAVPLRMQ
jgi:hypothetical protein